MIGSWRWNIVAALSFAALIFLLSWRSNPIETAGMRTAIAFGVTFAVTYVVRWMLGQALAPAAQELATGAADDAPGSDAGKGTVIDASTPDEESETELDFAPLSPPRLAKTEPPLDPELLAQALRHMSDK